MAGRRRSSPPRAVLDVKPTGVNPRTGPPRLRPERGAGGQRDADDHIKWIAFPNRYTADGTPGFESRPPVISCEHRWRPDLRHREPVRAHRVEPRVRHPAGLHSADHGGLRVPGDRRLLGHQRHRDAIYDGCRARPGRGLRGVRYAIPVARTAPARCMIWRCHRPGRQARRLVRGRGAEAAYRQDRHPRLRPQVHDAGPRRDRGAADAKQISCGMALAVCWTVRSRRRPTARRWSGCKDREDFYYGPGSASPSSRSSSTRRAGSRTGSSARAPGCGSTRPGSSSRP